jgi:galactose-3-O-sulfotransferase
MNFTDKPHNRMTPKSDDVLIFVHLPKCGGTTLNRIIEWEYDPRRVFSVDPSFFRWSYNRLKRWPRERLDHIDVFKGHMPFGLHARLTRPATYVTVLREPIDRAISAYYFAKTHRLHPDRREVRRLTLEEFVRNKDYHNLQCRLLAGIDGQYDFFDGECSSDTLEIAKANLSRHFRVVGLTERFDESLALMKIAFGWDIARYARFNVTKFRAKKNEVSASTLALIEECNQFDVALYKHVLAQFEDAAAQSRELAVPELNAIRAAKSLNGMESLYYMTASTIRKGVSRLCSAI